jgi:hypothetical protein
VPEGKESRSQSVVWAEQELAQDWSRLRSDGNQQSASVVAGWTTQGREGRRGGGQGPTGPTLKIVKSRGQGADSVCVCVCSQNPAAACGGDPLPASC